MNHDDFQHWLHGVRVLLTEHFERSDHAVWLIEAGATVTRSTDLERFEQLPRELDVAVVDITMRGASEVLELLPAACGVVLVADAATASAAELADRNHAAIVLHDAPRADFLFEVQRSAQLQVPDIGYLVGRAERLWKLPPQQARVLFYNLWSQSDREIAQAIGISVHTVQEHQNGLRRRTGVRTKHGYLRCLAEAAGMRPPLEDE